MRYLFIFLWLMHGAWACQVVHGQERILYEMEYEMELNLDGTKSYQARLYVQPNEAIFIYQPILNANTNNLTVVDSVLHKYTFNVQDSSTFYLWTQRMQQTFLRLDQLPGDPNSYQVTEPYTPIKWDLLPEEKLIQGYLCKRASAIIGGRHYSVWYTDRIPIGFGPWKLHDLPGLIIQANDDANEVYFHLKSFKRIDGIPKDAISFIQSEAISISQVEYLNKLEAYFSQLKKKLSSRFGREFNVQVSASGIKSIDRYEP